MIRYRYQGGNWIEIQGDSYTLDSRLGQCYTGYIIWFDVDVKYGHAVYNNSTNSWNWTEINQFTSRLRLVSSTKAEKIHTFPFLEFPNTEYDSHTPKIEGFKQVSAIFATTTGTQTKKSENTHNLYDAAVGSYYAHFFQAGTIRNIEVIPRNTEAQSCKSFCTIKIFNSGTLVHENTATNCPEVEVINNTQACPENTCEVICGDTICCYDSNGIAVESFPVN